MFVINLRTAPGSFRCLMAQRSESSIWCDCIDWRNLAGYLICLYTIVALLHHVVIRVPRLPSSSLSLCHSVTLAIHGSFMWFRKFCPRNSTFVPSKSQRKTKPCLYFFWSIASPSWSSTACCYYLCNCVALIALVEM